MTDLSGTVVDNQDDPVAGAVITIVNQTTSTVQTQTTTDSAGAWSVTGLPNDTYHVLAHHDSGSERYNSQSQPFIA